MPSNPVNFTKITIVSTTNFNGDSSIAIGDFNGDGQPDAVLSNSQPKNVSVLLNNSNGEFSAQTNYPTNSSNGDPLNVAISDFNGDGRADLVIFNDGSNDSILLGNGSGSFSAATTFASGNSNYGRGVVDDFNNDSKSDLFIPGYSSQGGNVLLGDGSGSFSAPIFIAGPSGSTATGDFDGNGKRDIVTVDNNVASVFLGSGTGSFDSGTTFAIGGDGNTYYNSPVLVGDFNGDGKQDLAVATYSHSQLDPMQPGSSSYRVNVLLNNGSGGFSNGITFAVGDSLRSVAVGDFNGDGKTDIATSEGSESDANLKGTFVRLNEGNDSFGSPTKISTLVGSLVTGDFNKDGTTDLAGFGDGIGTLFLSAPIPIPVPVPVPVPTPAPTPTPLPIPLPTPIPLPASPVGIMGTPLSPINFKRNKGLSLKSRGDNPNLFGKKGNDRLMGSKANNLIKGGAGDDLLNGGAGNDQIKGDAGNDILVGAGGKDKLIGGAGRDSFTFKSPTDGSDQVVDFQVGQDVIDLRGIFQQAAFQTSGSSFARFQQFIKLESVGASTAMTIDADGTGAGTTFVTLATLNNVATTAINSQSFAVG